MIANDTPFQTTDSVLGHVQSTEERSCGILRVLTNPLPKQETYVLNIGRAL